MENVSPIIAPDKSLMLQHLDVLFGRALSGKIEITGISTGDVQPKARTAMFGLDNLEAAVDFAAELNCEQGRNVYVGAALRHEDTFPGKAADDSDFLRAYAVWADADDASQVESARSAYRAAGISPPYVVVTGRTPSKRSQFWWPLETPIEDIEALRGLLRGVAKVLGTDPKVCTGKQLMRLAGTLNWPKKNDRVLERTEFVRVDSAAREFTREQLARAFPPMERAEFNDAVQDVEIAHGGALGLDEKVMDGREGYAFKLVRAHLHELIGTTGVEPTVDELYRSVAPVYLKKVDQVRPGRGPDFLKQKCIEAIRAFEAGQIPFMRDLDEAVQTYAERVREGEGRGPFEGGDEEFGFTPDDLFEVLSIADLRRLPDAEWLIKDVIPKNGLGFIYGPPGSFKTFVCCDLGLSLAYGLDAWIEKPIKHPGSVLYIANEGASGLKNRITAWQKQNGIGEDTGSFRVIRKAMSFMSEDDIERLGRTVATVVEKSGPVDTVFVDTVSRVLPGADENLQKDMTVFVAACDRLRERFGCTVIGVHHTNKNGEMRGSTVFLGQGDFVFRIDRSEGRLGGVLTCEKQKEAEDGWKRSFDIEEHRWTTPASIEPVSSLAAVFASGAAAPVNIGPQWPVRAVTQAFQKDIQDAFLAGKPLSTAPQSKRDGRHVIARLAHTHDVDVKVVEMVIETWLLNDVLEIAEVDSHSKLKGLRVLKWLD